MSTATFVPGSSFRRRRSAPSDGDLRPDTDSISESTLLEMFVRYFIELRLPKRAVEIAFEDPTSWIPSLADAASDHGHEVLSDVGFGETRRLEKRVKLEFSRPIELPAKTIIPMRWRPYGGREGMFPLLDADLEIAPMGPGVTQLAISARYEPPFGAVGRLIDRALLHRIAEATLKDFLDRVGFAVSAAASMRAS